MNAASGEATEDRHHRTTLFYGDEGVARIRRAHVTVVGLGGVGGHAVVNLARSGVGALHLVDFDEVTESSLNRSAFARPQDVGEPKTEALVTYLAEVCPDTVATFATARCCHDNLSGILQAHPPNGPAAVIDAIDSVADKIALLAGCHGNQIPIFTSMGAAGKRDVALVRTGPLAETRVCPLAKAVRLGLRERNTPLDIPCVWSEEKIAPNMSRPLPSQMSLPGVFGYALASLVLDHLANEEKR